ncbi:T9SS type A sorting domain-containing protein [Mucilaginibacter sp.]|uniref:T9SS type A sorting domain-containing protein n=1 Tax=Mucilaginibacter sp. TaxID=1882438 RepID=UPI0035BBC6E0
MKGILFSCLLVASCLVSSLCVAQSNYDWRGNISTDWSVAANWRINGITATTPPGSLDNVFIGNAAVAFTNQPSIPASYTASVASVTFGTVKIVALTVDGRLNITNDLTQKHSGSGVSISPTIAGLGTISCRNLINGDATAPPTPLFGTTSSTYATQLKSTVANLNVSVSLKMNTTSSNAIISFSPVYFVNNPTFFLDGGNMSIGTSIATTNSNYVNVTANSVTTRNVAELYISANTSAATLTLSGATPFAFDASGAGGVDFYNSGTFTSTVIYDGANDQTVYGTSQTRFGRSPANYQNIMFANTGVKNVQSDSLTVAGNWSSGNGRVDVITQNPTVAFKGGNQTLTDGSSDGGIGVTFKNVSFLGGGTKTMSSGKFNVATNGILSLAGSSTLNANGNLTIFSGSASSGAVAAIPANSSITGNVNVQRYLIGGNTKSGNVYTARGYRMLSSPVNINGTGVFSLGYIGNTALTGGPGTGFTVTNSNPTIYLYREDVVPSNTTFNSGKHKGITSINADNTVNVSGVTGSLQVPVGNGYIFYFVGNTSSPSTKASGTPTAGPENTIITATGNLNQSDIVTRLWYTPAGATVAPINTKLSYNSALGTSAGYNMVGNPYPATLNLATVIANNAAGISNNVYVLDNVNPGQQYIVYSSTGGSSPKATQYVASGQGFIVKALNTNATLTFRETQKATGNQPIPLLMGIPAKEALATGFYLKLEKDSLINDYCGVYFSSSSSSKFDDEDAKDLDGASSQVYLSSYSEDGIRTAVNHLPDYRPGIKNKLYVNATADGLYQLKIEGMRNIDTLYDVWLKDRMIKDSLNISRYGAYNFRITRSDTSSFGGNRFEIVIRPKPQPQYQLISFNAKQDQSNIQLNWEVANEGNFTGFEIEKLQPGTSGMYTSVYNVQSNGKKNYSYTDTDPVKGANTYRLKQNDILNKSTLSDPRTVIIGDALTGAAVMSIYPNPAAELINVTLPQTGSPASSIAKIYGYNGILIIQKNIQGNNWTQNVGQLMPGTYLVELSKPNGELIGRSKFIKK